MGLLRGAAKVANVAHEAVALGEADPVNRVGMARFQPGRAHLHSLGDSAAADRDQRLGEQPGLDGDMRKKTAHRKVRARVEHVFSRLKNYKILRDCRQRGTAFAMPSRPSPRMYNLASPHDRTGPPVSSSLPA
ncbi:hypothetical protein [Streptomyces sp. NPDC055036]